MKLMLIPALLLAGFTGPTAPIRFEADGVRVGAELVTGAAVSLKDSGALPLLVSGSVVESLSGESLAVALGEKQLALGAGLRLARTADGFRLSTHGLPFAVSAQGKTLAAGREASFKITETGFDFGALGLLDGASLAASVTTGTTAAASMQTSQDVEVSPEKTNRQGREKTMRRRYTGGDPLAGGQAASQVSTIMIARVTPSGAP